MPPTPPDSGPERIGEILSKLFTARGWGRRNDQLHLEKAWEQCVAKEVAASTRVMALRRGVLEVEVKGSVLMQELSQFHKRKILAQLRGILQGKPLTDVRFRVGNW